MIDGLGSECDALLELRKLFIFRKGASKLRYSNILGFSEAENLSPTLDICLEGCEEHEFRQLLRCKNKNVYFIKMRDCNRLTHLSYHPLNSMTLLVSLEIQNCLFFNHEVMRNLLHLPLAHLSIMQCRQFGDKGTAYISQMKNLISLELAETQITDISLVLLAQCTRLQLLNISYNLGLKGPGIVSYLKTSRVIEACPLVALRIGGNLSLKSSFWGSSFKIPNTIQILDLENSSIDDAGLVFLGRQDNFIMELSLCRCTQISDFGVKSLSGSSSLRVLNISTNPQLSDAAILPIIRNTEIRNIIAAGCKGIQLVDKEWKRDDNLP